jgi:4-amino-4-deoxy-L-arabinose transferase-like glycosyltransferase
MPLRLSYRWLLLALLAAALVIRLAAGVWWQQRLPPGRQFGFPDSEGYWELGRTIAQGRPYEFGPERYAIFRTPGYPILLSGLFLAGGNDPPVLWGRALSAILGTAAVAGVATLARLLFDERTALIAGAIAAVYPEAIALSVFVLSEAPLCPLLVWQLVAWTKAWRTAGVSPADPNAGGTPAVRWAVLAGVLAGLATLMRPSWLLFVPFAGLIGIGGALITSRNATEGVPYSALRRQLAITGVMLAALCLTLLPWWIRNYAVAGRFVPTTLQVGASLYDGLGPQATGASDMRFVPPFVAEQHASDAASDTDPSGTFEDRLDRRMRDASLAWAAKNPGRVIQLVGIKFLRMWNPLPNAAEFGSGTLRLVLALTYTPVIVLAAIGVWRFARRDWPYLLCLLPAVYFTCLHVIFVSSIRYRQPAMLVLIVLAAGVAAEWLARDDRKLNPEP